MKTKTINTKRFTAALLTGVLAASMVMPSYAAGSVNFIMPIETIYIKEPVVEVVPKLVLDYETAVKKALLYSITTKSAELQRETLQDKIDDLDYTYDTLFLIKDPDMLEGTLANLEIYNKSLTTNRDVMLRQKTVDSENLKITIAGLFNNIEQQLKTIYFMKTKLAQGGENLIVSNKQYDLGMIAKQTLEQAVLVNEALKNDLKLEEIKLGEYYAELEKITGLEFIGETYDLKPLCMDYKEVEVSPDDLKRYKADILNFDFSILAKQKEVENKTTTFDNYPEIYNFQHLSWLAGNQPSPPDFDYKSTRDEKNVAELNLSQTIINARLNLDKNYLTLQQLQQNIAIMRLELEKLEIQLNNTENRYKLGLVSKNVYQNTRISKQELETKLCALLVQQKQLRLLFESPYFAGMSMGA
ncbi:MAG: TolC family protein [Proteocatella sp.]